ncbi:hypothetical protein PILCRDRAFT_336444 [Piloderma croceum F 1598]|uniref:Uncharacterized protein n=1 Tax=Piloderma croceum (strain F 1598) TaxID=765440 RepID=A0A0C3C919_PILCF|nr:hypothetical protein PILCRDRAFT_336444 [Piloderma croceum F 1598]
MTYQILAFRLRLHRKSENKNFVRTGFQDPTSLYRWTFIDENTYLLALQLHMQKFAQTLRHIWNSRTPVWFRQMARAHHRGI